MVVITDAQRQILWINPKYSAVTGWSLEEIRGKKPRDFAHGPLTCLTAVARLGRSLREGESVSDFEMLNYRKSGEPFWVSLSIHPVLGEGGVINEYVAIERDITAYKHAQESVPVMGSEAGLLIAQPADLARVSHELRTPLHAVLGFAEMVERQEAQRLSEPSRANLRHIRHAAHHLLLTVNDILHFSRMEQGHVRFQLDSLDLPAVVSDVVSMLGPVAASRGVVLKQPTSGVQLMAVADRRRLVQVLINLIGNAIKFSRPQGVVELLCSTSIADAVAVAVVDHGVGIAARHTGRIFEPFYRVSDRATTEQSGSGLGLAIARGLVRGMGGDILVESQVGIGSTFTVVLRRGNASTVPAEDYEKPQRTASWAEDFNADARGSILYIEDSEVNRCLVQEYMRARPGVMLTCCDTASSGLDVARRLRPTFILVDMHLPDMSGHEVVREVMNDADLNRTPCVAFSADLDQREIEAAIRGGFREYLQKPASASDFLAMVDRMLTGERLPSWF